MEVRVGMQEASMALGDMVHCDLVKHIIMDLHIVLQKDINQGQDYFHDLVSPVWQLLTRLKFGLSTITLRLLWLVVCMDKKG